MGKNTGKDSKKIALRKIHQQGVKKTPNGKGKYQPPRPLLIELIEPSSPEPLYDTQRNKNN